MKPKEWDKISKSYFEEVTIPFAEGVKRKMLGLNK